MARDTVKYKNRNGITVELNTTYTVQCNPREVKPFMYTATGGSITAGEKNFSMTIVVVGLNNANEKCDRLLADVKATGYGVLTINDWNLDCKCIGISNIDADYNGVVRFVANFYAPNMVWYKNSSEYTPSGRGWSNALNLTIWQAFAVNVNLSSRASGENLKYRISKSSTNTVQQIDGSFSSLSPSTFVTNYHDKTVVSSGLAYPINYLSDTSDVFRVYPPGAYYFCLDTGFNTAKWTITYLRGMPEWSTT